MFDGEPSLAASHLISVFEFYSRHLIRSAESK